MASLPPQQQRREASSSSSSRPRSQSRARSTISEDSQTVLLNTPSPVETPKLEEQSQSSHPPPDPEADVKKCWICFADETEDTPESSRWRDPCPCALVAHEDCLLDWIADMESPSSRKRTLGPPKLLCPQCKAEIHLARPRDPIVEVVRASERLANKIVTPAALTVVASTIVQACTLHGIHSIYAVFGFADGWRILRPVLVPTRAFNHGYYRGIVQNFLDHWRLQIGLPLITPMLILSRTQFADSVLPVLPIVFFATQGDSDQPLDFGHWPPSASLAMAVLPYLRGLYNAYYERVWAAHEKRWIKDIQPRQGQASGAQDGNDGDENGDGQGDEVEAEGIFEIRVDGNLWEDWDNNDQEPMNQNQGRRQQEQARMHEEREQIREDMLANGPAPIIPHDERAPALDAPPLADNDQGAAPAPQVPRNRPPQQPQPNQPVPPQQERERRLSISTTGLAEKVLGALLFPTIASLSGEALRLLLPTSWVSRPTTYSFSNRSSKATGLLQEKWGRSVVGGCLFVVLKDAVMLYVRWKMSQQHRKRRVLDYDRKKGKAGAAR